MWMAGHAFLELGVTDSLLMAVAVWKEENLKR